MRLIGSRCCIRMLLVDVCVCLYRYVREKNKKNSPAQVIDRLNKYAPDVRTWNPKPGAWLDLATYVSLV